jgi:hypothetical protein
MKYIVLRAPAGEGPVLFPREFSHRHVARLFAPIEVVAAGFARSAAGIIECYGGSVGLGKRARPELDRVLLVGALASSDAAAEYARVDGDARMTSPSTAPEETAGRRS